MCAVFPALLLHLQALQELLRACSAAGVDASKGPALSPSHLQHAAAAEPPGLYADGVGGAQGLLTQAATAAKSLQAAEQVRRDLVVS